MLKNIELLDYLDKDCSDIFPNCLFMPSAELVNMHKYLIMSMYSNM